MNTKIGIIVLCLLCGCLTWTSCNTNKPKDQYQRDSIPAQKLPFELELSAEVYPTSVKSLHGTLYNNTQFSAIYGEGYTLEYYNKDTWEEVIIEPNDGSEIMFSLVGYILGSNNWRNFDATMWPEFHTYQPGRYRITKETNIELHHNIHVSDPQNPKDTNLIQGHNSEYFSLKIHPNRITVATDTIMLEVTNHSDLEITTRYINLTRSYQNEQKDIFHTSFHDSLLLKPNETKKYKIILSSNQRHKNLNRRKGSYLLKPGQYDLHPYFTIKLVKEFELSDSKQIKKEYEKNKDKYTIRDIPEYPGGKDNLSTFVKQNFQMPEKYRNNRSVVLRASCGFKVDALGAISDVKITYASSDSLFDKEVLRVVKKIPHWLPVSNSRGTQESHASFSIVFKNGEIDSFE